MIRSIIIALMGVAFLTACHSDSPSKKNSTGRTSFFESDGMDSTVSPGDNFFNFANGKWVKNTIIPDDQSRWGSFTTLYQDNLLKLKGLLEEAAKANAPANSDIQKLGDFYTSGMDTFAIDKLGATPLKNGLQEIANIKYKKDVESIAPVIDNIPSVMLWTIDRGDIDKVLRIEATDNVMETICNKIQYAGYSCEELA